MQLEKDGFVKEVTKEKTIKRLISSGWVESSPKEDVSNPSDQEVRQKRKYTKRK